MTVKERIESLKPYFYSFNVIASEDAAYVLLKFPSKWTIPDQTAIKENYQTEIAVRQEGVYFMTEINNGTDCLFDAAEYVITFNKNVEERKSLLNEKIKELTTIFATETLDNLKKLTFTIPNTEKSSKKRGSKSIEKVTKPEEKIEGVKPVENLPKTEKVEESVKKEPIEEDNNDNDVMSLAKSMLG